MEDLLNLMEYAARAEDFELFMMAKSRLNKKLSHQIDQRKKYIDGRFFEIEQGLEKPIVITIY